MTLKSLLGAIGAAVLVAPVAWAQDTVIARADMADRITTSDVSFMARDSASGATCHLEGSDLESQHAPWSTFKLPNLVIALELGIAEDLDAMRVWDQQKRPAAGYWPKDWRQDQDLRSAFRRSAVWYFQDIAVDVGTARYREVLADWDYGNATVPKGSDSFWLASDLRISPVEQVAFVEALVTGMLDVSDPAIAALTEASFVWRDDQLALHGKTGSGPTQSGAFEGWYVGWVARADAAPISFALYTTAPAFQDLRTFRKDFAIEMLKACAILPDAEIS